MAGIDRQLSLFIAWECKGKHALCAPQMSCNREGVKGEGVGEGEKMKSGVWERRRQEVPSVYS